MERVEVVRCIGFWIYFGAVADRVFERRLNMWFNRKERCQGSFQGFWCEQLGKKKKMELL